MNKLASHDEFIKFIDEVSVSLASKIIGLVGPLEGLLDRSLVIDSDLTKLSEKTDGVIDIAEAESRVARLEKIHRESGLAKDYPGTGWYKATDTGVVYNKDVPEGETHIFEGDPIEYISVWRNEGIDPNTFGGTEEDIQKLVEWHNNLHRYATSNVTDMTYWLYAYGNVDALGSMGIPPESVVTDPVDISHYDTSNVTIMSAMFAASTFNQPLDNFDTSNVTNMSYMFLSAITFNQDISSWDTSSVNSMESMFERAESFNQDLSQWCVPLITSAPGGFDGKAISWTLPKPSWGTCPRGEDKA